MHDKKDYNDYINSEQWQQKRREAFAFHGRECAKCHSTERLHVHHKTYSHFKNERIEIDLIPLCEMCHVKVHKFCNKRKMDLFHGTEAFIEHEPSMKKGKKQKRKKKRRDKEEHFYPARITPYVKVPMPLEMRPERQPKPEKKLPGIDVAKFMAMYGLSEKDALSILHR